MLSEKEVQISKPSVLSFQKKNGSIEIPISVKIEGTSNEPLTFLLEAVLSNADGTASGDKVLTKEIEINPTNKEEEPSIMEGGCVVAEQSFYYENSWYITSSKEELIYFQLFDMQGKQIVNQTIKYVATIDLSTLQSGLYIIKQTQGNNTQTFNLVK